MEYKKRARDSISMSSGSDGELGPRERVERAYERGYRVTEEGVPVNSEGEELTGSPQEYWNISVWMDGTSRGVRVAHLSARCNWREERYERAMDAIEENDRFDIVPENGNPLDTRPENLTLKKRPRDGRIDLETEEEIVHRFREGESKNGIARELGISKGTVYSVLEDHESD